MRNGGDGRKRARVPRPCWAPGGAGCPIFAKDRCLCAHKDGDGLILMLWGDLGRDGPRGLWGGPWSNHGNVGG